MLTDSLFFQFMEQNLKYWCSQGDPGDPLTTPLSMYLPFLNNFKVGKPDMATSATSLAVESILAIEYLRDH